MRSIASLLVVFALPALHATRAPAQVPSVPDELTRLSIATPAASAQAPVGKRALWAAGSAVIGAWIGYFASQVHTGDWDQPDRQLDRAAWTATGAALGVAVGLSVPLPGRTRPARVAVKEPDRSTLPGDEIRRAGYATAYEGVRYLRPEWLVLRGVGAWRETPRVTMDGFGPTFRANVEQEGETALKVYLNGVLLGGVDDLKTVSGDDVGMVELLTAAAATLRWGGGHGNGAILLTTR